MPQAHHEQRENSLDRFTVIGRHGPDQAGQLVAAVECSVGAPFDKRLRIAGSDFGNRLVVKPIEHGLDVAGERRLGVAQVMGQLEKRLLDRQAAGFELRGQLRRGEQIVQLSPLEGAD